MALAECLFAKFSICSYVKFVLVSNAMKKIMSNFLVSIFVVVIVINRPFIYVFVLNRSCSLVLRTL